MSDNANAHANTNALTLDTIEELVSVTVLNRQTNGPIPDYDMEICVTTQEEEFELPPTHALERVNCNPLYQESYDIESQLPPRHALQRIHSNFVDYTIDDIGHVFYFTPQARNLSDEEIRLYNEENKIQEMNEMELVMPSQCPNCYCFSCLGCNV